MTKELHKTPVSVSLLNNLVRETTRHSTLNNSQSTLTAINTQTQLVDWLMGMVYRKELFNHPEREFETDEDDNDHLSDETLDTRLFVYDFQNAISSFAQCCNAAKKEAISDFGRHFMLLVLPIDESEDCYSAAYISRQLVTHMQISDNVMLDQIRHVA
ncbi:hypothetical protein [Photobacterium leiognathi]|uniref:hypothetical protein n=1 Tax=Photobacterium leiognathi TaxID=553611 RepID=UPI00298136F9|nr:hypothetical protein [Photobacterium leiognathi]